MRCIIVALATAMLITSGPATTMDLEEAMYQRTAEEDPTLGPTKKGGKFGLSCHAASLILDGVAGHQIERYVLGLVVPREFNAYEVGRNRELAEALSYRFGLEMDAIAEKVERSSRGYVAEISRLLPLPFIVVDADQEGIAQLIEYDEVAEVYCGHIMRPFLNETTILIGADALNVLGGTGHGFSVAVLDSGVQLNHPALSQNVIAEACFASGFPGYPGCPPGHEKGSTSPGASEACVGSDECDHGTHVAAIAMASLSPGMIQGVAPFAGLVSIRLSSVAAPDHCNSKSPCVSFHYHDTAEALTWIYNHSDELSIAAFNMSFGH